MKTKKQLAMMTDRQLLEYGSNMAIKHQHQVGDKLVVQLWATFECTIKEQTRSDTGKPTYTVLVHMRNSNFYDVYESMLFATVQDTLK